MIAVIAAINEWADTHPFLTHVFAPLAGATLTLVLIPLPWLLLVDGIPALSIPPFAALTVERLFIAAGVGGAATMAAQLLSINEDTVPSRFFGVALSKRGWIRLIGSWVALLVWPFLAVKAWWVWETANAGAF